MNPALLHRVPPKSASAQYDEDSDDSESDDDSESKRQARQGRHYRLEISTGFFATKCLHFAFLSAQSICPDGQLVWQYFERAVIKYQRALLASPDYKATFMHTAPEHVIKYNVHVRLIDLCGGLMKPSVSSIRSENAGQFIQIKARHACGHD